MAVKKDFSIKVVVDTGKSSIELEKLASSTQMSAEQIASLEKQINGINAALKNVSFKTLSYGKTSEQVAKNIEQLNKSFVPLGKTTDELSKALNADQAQQYASAMNKALNVSSKQVSLIKQNFQDMMQAKTDKGWEEAAIKLNNFIAAQKDQQKAAEVVIANATVSYKEATQQISLMNFALMAFGLTLASISASHPEKSMEAIVYGGEQIRRVLS